MGAQRRRQLNKWVVLGVLWVCQAVVGFVGSVFWLIQGTSVDTDTPWGVLRREDIFDVAFNVEFLSYFGLWIGLFTVLQGLFLLPVRRPTAKSMRGPSIWVSLSIAGLVMAFMVLALGAAIVGGAVLVFGDTDFLDGTRHPAVSITVASVSWVLFTFLLIRFCRVRPRETLLSRVASTLFLGTIVEVAAIMPIDIMLRRKMDCYCWAPTYFALSICGTIGLFIAGPAVFLSLFGKRRKRWYEGRCDACGYDMSGCSDADRCPECGAGWRMVKGCEMGRV